MHELNAHSILAQVMGWEQEDLESEVRYLSQFARFKYDNYERYQPGRRFIESLALWLSQMDKGDRAEAYELVKKRLIYISNAEMAHLVQIVYPDIVDVFLQGHAARQLRILPHNVGEICGSKEYKRARERCLFLGMSDGSRTHELRRFNPEIKNDQVYHAYDSSDEKYERMLKDHRDSVGDQGLLFEHLWLLDDFSGSGRTFIRNEEGKYKGKLSRIMSSLASSNEESALRRILAEDYTIHIVIYALTKQAEDQIRDLANQCADVLGLRRPEVRSVMMIPEETPIHKDNPQDFSYIKLIEKPEYYDARAENKHTEVGGTSVRFGFSDCGLPLVLEHNAPNNSIYILWGPLEYNFHGLFPRVNRHS